MIPAQLFRLLPRIILILPPRFLLEAVDAFAESSFRFW
jgi:hypothetical protein